MGRMASSKGVLHNDMAQDSFEEFVEQREHSPDLQRSCIVHPKTGTDNPHTTAATSLRWVHWGPLGGLMVAGPFISAFLYIIVILLLFLICLKVDNSKTSL